MISTLIFDKDGTLFDFQATWGHWTGEVLAKIAAGNATQLNAIANELRYDLDKRELRPDSVVIAGTPAEIVQVIKPHVPEVSEQQLLGQLNELAKSAPQVEIIPLGRFFETLREMGLNIAVMTNDAEEPARAHLSEHDGAIDVIVGSDSGFGAKPDPDPLLAIARKLGVDPETCVMIGDSTHDLRAGRSAGMKCIAVLTGLATEQDLRDFADLIIQDIGDLPDILKADHVFETT